MYQENSYSFRSMYEVFENQVKKRPNQVAARVKKNNNYVPINWSEMHQTVLEISCGLLSLNVEKESHIAIISSTRFEWVLADLSILGIGAITVPVYQSNSKEECAYILKDAQISVVFVEDEKQLNKIESILEEGGILKKVIIFDGESNPSKNIFSLNDLRLLGVTENIELKEKQRQRSESLSPQSIQTIIYTSGTTGSPKGVMLSHENFISQCQGADEIKLISAEDDQLTFLPLAHVLAKHLECLWFYVGHVMSFAESVDKLVQNMGEVNPTVIVSVPRIFEKVYTKVVSSGIQSGGFKSVLFRWALKIEMLMGQYEHNSQVAPFHIKSQWLLAKQLVFSKIHTKLNEQFGGKIRFFVSGGAPLAVKIASFFRHAGITILEGYGMTETSGANAVNLLSLNKIGTVGPVFPRTEVKIADDGEILIKGPCVMQGYFNRLDATREVLIDGYMHTGDIGRLDSEGYLIITDRKKDIIVTAGGKKISPQEIESQLKTSPLVSQVVVLGDSQKYVVALFTLNWDAVRQKINSSLKGQRHSENVEALVENEMVLKLLQRVVDDYNQHVANHEKIRKFTILENDFSQETGELTPSLKVKRKFVANKYKTAIESMYEQEIAL